MDRRNFYSKCERALLLSHFIQSGTLAAIKICLLAMFDDETIEYKYIEAAINLVYAIGRPIPLNCSSFKLQIWQLFLSLL